MRHAPRLLVRFCLSWTMLVAVGSFASSEGLRSSEEDLIQLLERVRPYNVVVQLVIPPERRRGFTDSKWVSLSGTLIDEEGTIATSVDAVRESNWIYVILNDGQIYRARPLGLDSQLNLGFIRIDGYQAVAPPPIGDSDRLVPGSFIAALGSPYGLQGTVTTGIVSSYGRTLDKSGNQAPGGELVQIQAPVNPGDVGGTLVNSRGEIVGVIASPLWPSLGSGALNEVRRELDALLAVIHLIDREHSHDLGSSAQQRWQGRTGYDAHLTAVDRDSVWTWFRERLRLLRSGSSWTKLEKEVPRSGSEGIHFAIPIHRVLEARMRLLAADEGGREKTNWGNWMGITVDDAISSDLAAHLKLADDRGLLIYSVVRNGPSAKAGIEEYDILWTMDGHPVAGLETLSVVFEGGFRSRVPVTVVRKGRLIPLVLEFDEAPGNEKSRGVPKESKKNTRK